MNRDDHINIFFSEEDGGYIADVPNLAACSAFGETAEEALREVERVRDAWLAAAREACKPITPLRYRAGSTKSPADWRRQGSTGAIFARPPQNRGGH